MGAWWNGLFLQIPVWDSGVKQILVGLILKRLAHGLWTLIQKQIELLLVHVPIHRIFVATPADSRKLVTDSLQNRTQLRDYKLYVSAGLLLNCVHILDFVKDVVEQLVYTRQMVLMKRLPSIRVPILPQYLVEITQVLLLKSYEWAHDSLLGVLV